jgi:mono/diheme cytochrome c family protein
VYAAAALPAAGSQEEAILKGKRFFNTGLGRWSLKGQGWGACQSCHIDGLTDNVTWHFARGPRQSTSLEGSFSKKDATDQRIFNWTAIFDEIADFEGNTRGVSGGVGAIVSATSTPPAATDRIDTAAATLPPGVSGPNQGLSGSSTDLADVQNPLGLDAPSKLKDWEEITKFVQKIRPPRGATNLDKAKVDAGKTLFAVDGACGGCHGGDKWTISKLFYKPSFTETEANKTTDWTPPTGFPIALLPAANAGNRFMRFGGTNPAAFDQLQCILRPVGTFGVFDPLTGISELRQDMTTAGQGDQVDGKGFNPPSLLGVSVGGPYLHAGNAGSLEALFASTFQAHYAALAPNFLSETDATARAAKVSQLVHYLLSLDASTATVAIPATAGATGGDFCQ